MVENSRAEVYILRLEFYGDFECLPKMEVFGN